jgi:hypothetical protein
MQHNVHEGQLDGASSSEVSIGTRSRARRGRPLGRQALGEVLGLLPSVALPAALPGQRHLHLDTMV